jgi:hypothetical protein
MEHLGTWKIPRYSEGNQIGHVLVSTSASIIDLRSRPLPSQNQSKRKNCQYTKDGKSEAKEVGCAETARK